LKESDGLIEFPRGKRRFWGLEFEHTEHFGGRSVDASFSQRTLSSNAIFNSSSLIRGFSSHTPTCRIYLIFGAEMGEKALF